MRLQAVVFASLVLLVSAYVPILAFSFELVARPAIGIFPTWAASRESVARLTRLASASGIPPGLRGEIVLALSYGHLFHWRGRVLGPSAAQQDLLRTLQNDPDPLLASLARAGGMLHTRGLWDHLHSVQTIHVLS